MYTYVKYDADMEEPNCCRCDHCINDNGLCEKCGPEYWWANYRRTEVIKGESDNDY